MPLHLAHLGSTAPALVAACSRLTNDKQQLFRASKRRQGGRGLQQLCEVSFIQSIGEWACGMGNLHALHELLFRARMHVIAQMPEVVQTGEMGPRFLAALGVELARSAIPYFEQRSPLSVQEFVTLCQPGEYTTIVRGEQPQCP